MMGSSVISMLIELKNASMAKKPFVEVPYTKFRESLSSLLLKKHRIHGVKKFKKGKFSYLRIDFLAGEADPAAHPADWHSLRIISKPGQRIYLPVAKLARLVRKGRRSMILSTSRGLMSIEEAKKKRLGGEAICELKG